MARPATTVARQAPRASPWFLATRATAWITALVALGVVLVVMLGLGGAQREQRATDKLPDGYDSTLATQLSDRLGAATGSGRESVAILVFSARSGGLDADQRAALTGLAQQVGATPQTFAVAADGTAAMAVLSLPDTGASAAVDRIGDLRAELREAVPAGVRVQVTGPAAIEADLAQVFDGANTRLLLATALVVAFLLVVTYRSPVLWLAPLLVVGLADRVAAVLATQAMATFDVAWNESTIGILSVLVFGAGTDYALLLISRYRDELRHVPSRYDAMGRAVRGTLEPVLASATTVVLALLTLLLSLTPTTRGLGLACAIGIVTAAAFVLLVLPAVLVLLGRWVFWPRVPRYGDPGAGDRQSFWGRVGAVVARRPVVLIASTGVLLVVLASGLLRIDVGLKQSDQFLDKPEAIAAGERLARSFPAGTSSPTEVLTRASGAEVDRLVQEVSTTAGVASARLGASAGGLTRVDVVLDATPSSRDAAEAVTALRRSVADFPDTHVGGDEAVALDERAAASRNRMVVLPLILLVVLAALVLLLRSLLAPVLLVATVLGTYAAAMGASWWLFTGVLGFDALDNQVPLFAFLFLVALGVDYNIFLVTRAREEARGLGTRDGMLRALSVTGGVITSAGILLGAVFAVLGVLPLVVLAQLGVIICLGVLLDTLLVRTVLVPALAVVLGERFWWPASVSSREPKRPASGG
jgi:putative drug exporter of the RND superfamily